MCIRKILKSEIKPLAKEMADCFCDYPLYDVFFPNKKKKAKQTFYLFWFRMYTRQDYTYINDEKNAIISIMRPGDKEHSPLKLLLNPIFTFGALFHLPIHFYPLLKEFFKMSSELDAQYYDSEKDIYVKAVCIKKEARGTTLFHDILREFDDGSPFYAETHTQVHERLYRMMGAELCNKQEWHGITHYIVKRPGKQI